MAAVASLAVAAWMVPRAMAARAERDVLARRVAQDEALLATVRAEVGQVGDSLARVLAAQADDSLSGAPYLVISLAENRLWFKRGAEVLFQTRVASGTGKELRKQGGKAVWKFETPRGRLVVQRKDVEPAWVPPDWHYVEQARKKKKRLVRLERGVSVPLGNGAVLTIAGNDVVSRWPDGRVEPLEARDGNEIIVGDRLIMPPLGTNQRKYIGVLGSNRLYLGDGYGIHGTDVPSSIGRAASHGCVRVRNEDIEVLWRIVPVGTPVYVY